MNVARYGRGGEGGRKTTASGDSPIPTVGMDDFHSEVRIARALFLDGYYDEAVRKASQRFVNRAENSPEYPMSMVPR